MLRIFSGGVVWTQMGMGSAQAISAAWLTSKMEDYKRPIALAAYVMCIQLANFPGNQLFRTQGMISIIVTLPIVSSQFRDDLTCLTDAPRYKYGLIVAASCAIAAAVVILVWKLLYRLFDGGDSGVEAKNDLNTSEDRGTDANV